MADKTDGKVFWETKDGDRRLMVSWQAKKGETKTPIPQVEAKIIPLMLKMKVDEANVKFDLVSGNPRNIEFVDAQAADEAKKKVEEQTKIQQKNAEEFEQSVKPIEEKTATMEKPINTDYSKDFHNPYNFVPAIPRGSVTGELADREPIGHDRFYPNHLSGKLAVKMTVETPLVVLDTAKMSLSASDPKHKQFPVRIENGKPFINPTAVKGMLRSAYEAVTNSRMSSFSKSHSEKITYRGGKAAGFKKILYTFSPKDLIEETYLLPANFITQLSPADRVFGWVRQGKLKINELNTEENKLPKEVKEISNYRGQIRVGSISLSKKYKEKPIDEIIHKFGEENNSADWLPLNILGQPKPQQGRFYVAKDKDGNAQDQGLTNEKAGYNDKKKGLRGRKVYPHHANITGSWTVQNNLSEYVRPNKEQDSQNRSIEGWIKPQTEFTFDIHFTNLSEVELGALVWLLSMDEKHFHRFGGGKSLGFGSVKLSIENSEITSGKDLIEFYGSLDSTRNQSKTPEGCKTEFEKIANQDILNSFKVACKGFTNELPTHYPRIKKELDAETKSFEWFVDNNKGRKLTLPNLSNEVGLPLNPTN